MARSPIPAPHSPLVLSDRHGQWVGRCRSANAQQISFHVVSLTPPDWQAGHNVQLRWADAGGLWSVPITLVAAQAGYAGRFAARPALIDTRRTPRLPIAVRVDYGLVTPDLTGVTKDVSLLGASFLAGLRAEPGETLHLVLGFMPTPISLRARVVRSRPESGYWRLGVSWDDCDSETADRLRFALRTARRQHATPEDP